MTLEAVVALTSVLILLIELRLILLMKLRLRSPCFRSHARTLHADWFVFSWKMWSQKFAPLQYCNFPNTPQLRQTNCS